MTIRRETMLILSANDQKNLAEMNEVLDHVAVALRNFRLTNGHANSDRSSFWKGEFGISHAFGCGGIGDDGA